jgi:hypothetical protein
MPECEKNVVLKHKCNFYFKNGKKMVLETSLTTTYRWGTGKKLLFRFFAMYFFLYIFCEVIALENFWDSFILWLSRLLKVSYQPDTSPDGIGSGDTLYIYLQVLSLLFFAFAGSLVWFALDRKRPHYDKLLYWLFVLLRYMLAFFMISYGFSKIFKVQFPFPYLERLLQPVGTASPMGLAWTFMGYSRAYNLFTGCAEAIGGVLILFRRTAIFGALFCITVLSNIVAMNLCYDIPVKLFSIHLLLIAMFITVPDLQRLLNFFFLNKPMVAKAVFLPFQKKWMRVTHLVLKCLVVATIILSCANDNFQNERIYGDKAPRSTFYGVYTVDSFVKNRIPVQPLITDTMCWRYFVIDKDDLATVRTVNDKVIPVRFQIDTADGLISVKNKTATEISVMHYLRPDKDHLILTGNFFKDTIHVTLKKKNLNEFLLISRGFHWISEQPYNR